MAIAASATTSWPWPRDTLWNFLFSNVYPRTFPNASTSFKGLTPRDRMKNIGVEGPRSR